MGRDYEDIFEDDNDFDTGDQLSPMLVQAVRAAFWKDAYMALLRSGESPTVAARSSDAALQCYDERRATADKPTFGL